MPKNIVIFSDGTGQAGGLLPDERRTNVYKLFRATRVGPDTTIDPQKQQAFYDPGLGSKADGGGLKIGWWRWIYNLVSQVTGFGITQNIIDCYAEIIRLYQPGDRIFLFGFSRGAYTVRCVGGVLYYCGVPTRAKDGSNLKRDPVSVRKIASEAVKCVYQHGAGRKADRFKKQRINLARHFRNQYGSDNKNQANVAPYFIGVWDTVASTGVRWPAAIGLAILVLVISAYLAWQSRSLFFAALPFSTVFWIWLAGIVLIAVIWMLAVRLRVSRNAGVPWWQTLHFTGWRMRFYNTSLSPAVQYAKHALAIDEHRKDFARVPWTDHGDRPNDDDWFEQVWFAGNHSDIGGSYPENEARLSDISFHWMIDKARNAKEPLLIDDRFLHLFPSSAGMQHDECKSGKLPWKKQARPVDPTAPLHPTVIERFKLASVLHYDETKPYRPENLRGHDAVKGYYPSDS